MSCVSMLLVYIYNTDGRSVINTTSMISNPDDVMDTYSVVVTCEINPTSTAEYCEVSVGNTDTPLVGKFTMQEYGFTMYMYIYVLCIYIYIYVCIHKHIYVYCACACVCVCNNFYGVQHVCAVIVSLC